MLDKREGFQLMQLRLGSQEAPKVEEIVLQPLEPSGKNPRGSRTRIRDPSFTAPLAETKHERSVVLLQLGIYSLSTPTCTYLHALSRLGCVIFTCFIFAYHYECYE